MIRRALSQVKNTLGRQKRHSNKYIIKSFAENYGMVYFGGVSQHKDEHSIVRGITISARHRDQHYCVGSIHDHDAVLLERTDTLRLPSSSPSTYTWLILQLDLHVEDHAFGHLYVNGNRYDRTFYDNLSIKYRQLQRLNTDDFLGHDPRFIAGFTIYGDARARLELPPLLTTEVTAILAHHFAQFDFELFDDKLLVYSTSPIASHTLLDDMTRAGMWLAKHLESLPYQNRES